MKKIIVIFVFLFSFFCFFKSNANLWDSLTTGGSEVIYCSEQDSCSLDKGVELVKDSLDNNIEKDRKASEYIQDVVIYILSFVTIIGILYIIYAGFLILTSAGDEDKRTSQKKIILSVFIGIALIWLSVPIIKFIMNVLSA